MRRLIAIAAFIALASPQAALADLGAADTTPEPEAPKQTSFDAWCVKKYVDCLAQLENGRLMVDEGKGISAALFQ